MNSLANPRSSQLPIGPHTLHWGVVGASTVVRLHTLAAIRGQPPSNLSPPQAGAYVAVVHSHSLARAKRLADECQIPFAVERLSALLAHPNLDCVYISSHPRHHAEAVHRSLLADKHVLCESPLALSLEEAAALVTLAEKRKLVLAINQTLRAAPALVHMRRLLADFAIGELLGGDLCNALPLPLGQQSWRLRQPGGGVLLDRTLGNLDLLAYVTQDQIALAHGWTSSKVLGVDVPDHAILTLQMAGSGALMQIRDSYVLPHAASYLALYGSAGTLLARDCFLPDQPGQLALVRHGQSTSIPLDPPALFQTSVYHFQQAVRSGSPPLASGQEQLAALSLISGL